MNRKTELEKEMNELQVLQSELSNTRKGAKIYQQQQNSNVFFLADKDNIFQKAKRNLDDLVQEYKVCEDLKTCQEQTEEG